MADHATFTVSELFNKSLNLNRNSHEAIELLYFDYMGST